MEVRRIVTSCKCGAYATPNALYVTVEGDLMVECFCIKCTVTTNCYMPISEIQETADDMKPKVVTPAEFTEEDKNFLNAMLAEMPPQQGGINEGV